MQTYRCPACGCSISEADKHWDSTIDSGRCPYCQVPLKEFPVPVKSQGKGAASPTIAAISSVTVSHATAWKRVSDEEARKHPLYGVKGWLIGFAFSVGFEFLKLVGWVGGEVLTSKLPSKIVFLKLVLTVNVPVVVLFYWLLFSKNPNFRMVSMCVLLGEWPVIALISIWYPFPGMVDPLALGFLQWVMFCAIWVSYLQRSRRVRVTVEHMVKENSA